MPTRKADEDDCAKIAEGTHDKKSTIGFDLQFYGVNVLVHRLGSRPPLRLLPDRIDSEGCRERSPPKHCADKKPHGESTVLARRFVVEMWIVRHHFFFPFPGLLGTGARFRLFSNMERFTIPTHFGGRTSKPLLRSLRRPFGSMISRTNIATHVPANRMGNNNKMLASVAPGK